MKKCTNEQKIVKSSTTKSQFCVDLMELKDFKRMIIKTDKELSIEEYLEFLKVSELNDLKKRLEVKGNSKLKKSDLVRFLSEEIKEKLPYILKRLTEEEFKFILSLIKNSGKSCVNLFDLQLRKKILNIKKWGVIYIASSDMVKTEVKIPLEFVEIINKLLLNQIYYDDILKRHKWIKIAKGLLFYYGVMNADDLYHMVKEFVGEDIQSDEFLTQLNSNAEYKDTILKRNDIYYFKDVLSPEVIYIEQQKRKDINFAKLNINEVLNASCGMEINLEKHEKDFYNYILLTYNTSEEYAREIIEKCKYLIKNNYAFSEILDLLSKKFNIKDLSIFLEITKHIENLWNNTKLWVLKGNTSIEVYKEKNSEEKKVGRNDPCICGSGKKYKKCCGN
ncbi:hypothetical protein Q428_07270 [Fervidicella metallireducens AeB]|uniref:Zinc chelation protein SecC n=1 Tax=Fervidicella metallireducens AeB TaxID=1403537 RepID=A0A017RV12_9CLOT|nr:SEC-C metal-binding domain-containing protein [Fervidicella metallireducens]EYE88578.1 hypothetical protein Q428_07270 [Fervidicella metallireducens AeB]